MEIKNLSVYKVCPFSYEDRDGLKEGMVISWDASIGYGRITIFKEDDKWIADTECMCIDEDKDFLKMVLEKWIEDIKIVG